MEPTPTAAPTGAAGSTQKPRPAPGLFHGWERRISVGKL